MAATIPLSLDACLSRRRLGDVSGAILIHGCQAHAVPWLLRHVCAKAGQDQDSAILVSDKLPGDLLDAPGVGLMRLHTVPVAETCSSSTAMAAASPLACVAAGISDCLSRRGAVVSGGHDTATMPVLKVAVAFESIATLLLAHPFNEVVRFIDMLPEMTIENARAGPVVIAADAGVIGVASLLSLESIASLIIRVDSLPGPFTSESGYEIGEMVITELLKSGKERSFLQTYSVHPNGTVVLTAANLLAPGAALMPLPVVPAAAFAPVGAGTVGASKPATTAPTAAPSTPLNASVDSLLEGVGLDMGRSRASGAKVSVQMDTAATSFSSLVDKDGRPLLYYEASDLDAGEEDDNDDIDGDLDL